MIVHQEPIPPIWHPVARFRRWRARRVRARAVCDFSSYLMPIIKPHFPASSINELVSVQPMSAREAKTAFDEHRHRVEPQAREIAEQMSDEAVLKWNVVYRSIPWYHRLWRWAKGDPGGGCCR